MPFECNNCGYKSVNLDDDYRGEKYCPKCGIKVEAKR